MEKDLSLMERLRKMSPKNTFLSTQERSLRDLLTLFCDGEDLETIERFIELSLNRIYGDPTDSAERVSRTVRANQDKASTNPPIPRRYVPPKQASTHTQLTLSSTPIQFLFTQIVRNASTSAKYSIYCLKTCNATLFCAA